MRICFSNYFEKEWKVVVSFDIMYVKQPVPESELFVKINSNASDATGKS